MICITLQSVLSKKNTTLPQEQKQLHKISQPAEKNTMGFCCPHLNLLNISQLLTNFIGITTCCGFTPCNHKTITSYGCKGTPSRLNIPQQTMSWDGEKLRSQSCGKTYVFFLNAFHMVPHASVGFHFVVIFVPWLFLQVGMRTAEKVLRLQDAPLETRTAGCPPYKWWFPSSVFLRVWNNFRCFCPSFFGGRVV